LTQIKYQKQVIILVSLYCVKDAIVIGIIEDISSKGDTCEITGMFFLGLLTFKISTLENE